MKKSSDIRVAFMGTPDFAVPSLKALVDGGYDVVACYCQPPKPIGRGHKVQKMPIHEYADSQGIPVYTPKSLKDSAQDFAAHDLDLAVVVAYGLILPKAILEVPRHGCVNVHGSLLPRWRGAAPLQRALIAGDEKTGISIMKMDEGLDTGPVILMKHMEISPTMTASVLHDQMAQLGAEVLIEALPEYLDGSLMPQEQPDEGVEYAHKVTKNEGALDWQEPAEILERKVRALSPWPGVWFEHKGERIKILAAKVIQDKGAPGEILDDILTVACHSKALRLLKVQRAGKAPTETEAFLRGYDLPKGTQL